MAPTAQTIVIKIGTSSLVNFSKKTFNIGALAQLCEAVRNLKDQGHRVVIVSSGAVGAGCLRMRLDTRPAELAKRQALAAAGQIHLMRYYDDFFSAIGVTCAQVMLTLDNLAVASQFENTCTTFEALFEYDIVPVVNENDTVAVEELRSFGDNDTLSAKVATAVKADWLFLLTDVDAMYTTNPATNPDAQPIHEVHDIGQLQVDTDARGTQWGTGGMSTKLTAARIATACGCHTVICKSTSPEDVQRILGENGVRTIGTVFYPHPRALKGKKRWILMMPPTGQLWLDAGAVAAVRQRAKSLFSAGIVRVVGEFNPQDCVSLCDEEGNPFAQGLCNYAHTDVIKLKGKSSADILGLLGYSGSEEVVHRSNISLTSLRNPLGAGGSASVQGLASADSGELRVVEGGTGGEAGPSSSDQMLRGNPADGERGRTLVVPRSPSNGTLQPTSQPGERPEWRGDGASGRMEEGAGIVSPRSDSATSLTAPQATARVAEAGGTGSQAFSPVGPSPGDPHPSRPSPPTNLAPLQPPRTSQPTLQDDSPNPLPSPASGFSRRVQQRSPPPAGTSGVGAAYGSTPLLIVPSAATVSHSAAQSVPEGSADQGGALTAAVASAAVMSSQGPSRGATEEEIAARKALIAAAKAGIPMDLSPRDTPGPITSPSLTQAQHYSPATGGAPSSSRLASLPEEAGLSSAPAAHPGTSRPPPLHVNPSNPSSGTWSEPHTGRHSTSSSGGQSPSGVSGGGQSPVEVAAMMRAKAAGAAESLAKAPQSPRGNAGSHPMSTSGRGGAKHAPENFRPLSTAAGIPQPPRVRSIYTPLQNFSERRQDGLTRQPSDTLARKPSATLPPLTPTRQYSGGLPSPGSLSRQNSGPKSSLRKVPSTEANIGFVPGGYSAVAANPSVGSQAGHSSSQGDDVAARMAILRSREQGTPASPPKRVSFSDDRWAGEMMQAIQSEKAEESSGRLPASREDITDEGWRPT